MNFEVELHIWQKNLDYEMLCHFSLSLFNCFLVFCPPKFPTQNNIRIPILYKFACSSFSYTCIKPYRSIIGANQILSSNNRTIRESFIRAKYIDKAFVSKLPGPKASSKVKGWSVKRRPKRSPSRDVTNSQENSEEDSDLTSGIMEGIEWPWPHNLSLNVAVV